MTRKRNRQEYYRERYRARRAMALEMLGDKCVGCGDSEGEMHIDHINPDTKEHYLHHIFSTRSWEKVIVPELKKCQLLCTGCHENKTASENTLDLDVPF